MTASIEFLKNDLQSKGLRPTYLRLRVLEYLHSEEIHPTAEEIYHVLLPGVPSLSKATIYNTLNAFARVGLVRTVGIEDSELRYDITLSDHGHFQCKQCGLIMNFAIHPDRLLADDLGLFEIHERVFYFKGICPNCRLTHPSDHRKV